MTDNRDWIGRVKEADADAENFAMHAAEQTEAMAGIWHSLLAIAAELRAERIARRPGAGQTYQSDLDAITRPTERQ